MAQLEQKSITPDIPSLNASFQFNSQSTSPSRCRNQAGLEKLHINHRNKHLIDEISSVSNKINFIYKLEQQIKQKYTEDRQKAEADMNKKARNELKLKEKEIFKQYRVKEEQELRNKIKEEKQKRKENIRAMKEEIFRERLENVKEIKKNREELDMMGKSYKDLIRQQKFILKSTRIREVTQNKNKSNTFTVKITDKLKKDYEDRIQSEKQKYIDLINKKKDLEKLEAMALERYSATLVQTGLPSPFDLI